MNPKPGSHDVLFFLTGYFRERLLHLFNFSSVPFPYPPTNNKKGRP